jgi:phosphoribosylformylglycinamidine cyclo-ligase
MTEKASWSYADAGVDIDLASSMLSEIDKTRSRSAEVIKSPNDFAGLFSLKELCARFSDPVLVSGTDGVGTKLLVAIECDRYDGLGQDLVAMCVNDIATKGAEPLFFLDYFATSNLRSVPFTKIINSIVMACDDINCALIGGETAEMPMLYANKHFDLAGFAVGVVDRPNMLGLHRVREGDICVGIKSSGLHSNGFSLVRKIIFDKLMQKPNDVLWQSERGVSTVADELLRPTRIYSNLIKKLMKTKLSISAIAHITGGGILENLPRIIPANLMAQLDLSDMPAPRIFSYLMEHGPITRQEMLRTFNMGIGLIIIVPKAATDALAVIKDCGEEAFIIGEIMDYQGEERCRVKT